MQDLKVYTPRMWYALPRWEGLGGTIETNRTTERLRENDGHDAG